MPQPRNSPCVVVEGNTIILTGGAFKGEQKTVWKMDVEDKDKKWIDLPPLNQARSHSSAVKIEGGHILVTGGFTLKSESPNQVLNTVEIFNGESGMNSPVYQNKESVTLHVYSLHQ